MLATAWKASFRRHSGRLFGGIRRTLERVATTANTTLRAVRMGMLMSQDDFARAVRAAGARAGEPNEANKRLVQRWESGDIAAPRPVYARALESVTGLPIASLGFSIPVPQVRVSEDGHGGHDVEPAPVTVTRPTSPAPSASG